VRPVAPPDGEELHRACLELRHVQRDERTARQLARHDALGQAAPPIPAAMLSRFAATSVTLQRSPPASTFNEAEASP
jgi:hypothetical protein